MPGGTGSLNRTCLAARVASGLARRCFVASIDGVTGILRRAVPEDIKAMHRVRVSVRENQLVSTVLPPARYLEYLQARGRGWVIEADAAIVAFAIADTLDASLWALFVQPGYEGKGYGRRLHDTAVAWLFDQGHARIWLSTAPGTRAEAFYTEAGWERKGETPTGEIRLELASGRRLS